MRAAMSAATRFRAWSTRGGRSARRRSTRRSSRFRLRLPPVARTVHPVEGDSVPARRRSCVSGAPSSTDPASVLLRSPELYDTAVAVALGQPWLPDVHYKRPLTTVTLPHRPAFAACLLAARSACPSQVIRFSHFVPRTPRRRPRTGAPPLRPPPAEQASSNMTRSRAPCRLGEER